MNTNELPNHFTLIAFWCERRALLCSHSNGDIFTCEDNMLFSRAKIPSFRAKAHLVFHWCLYNKSKFAEPVIWNNYLTVSWPDFNQNWFTIYQLGAQNVRKLGLVFIRVKKGKWISSAFYP